MVLEMKNLLLPEEHDILLTDVTENLFHSIENELGVKNGSPTTDIPSYPVSGIVAGSYHRMWVPLIVSKRNVSIQTIFLYDTGSPFIPRNYELFGIHGSCSRNNNRQSKRD